MPIDFNRDIRPILSEYCYECHGPDAESRQADLRLDTYEGATAERGEGRAIDPSAPLASLLLERIGHLDPELRMPPTETGKKLSSSQIGLLEAWVSSGAHYATHWAFVPPKQPKLPPSMSDPWCNNGIDAFILESLSQNGLRPAARANRETLIRRLYTDLTGLPPAPNEVASFVHDLRSDAYEKVVDRLLSSPHFGERMALAWMDAARYGDTSALNADGHREMWPWRDWVINAYNCNKPFNDFLVEQLAGDLLPSPTSEQLVATGFNRNHPTSDETGANAEELRTNYTVDRLNTTFSVFQALSVECAQCHDHKYDPVSQREYYELYAFFNSASDPGIQRRSGNEPPVVALPDPNTAEAIKTISDCIEQLQSAFAVTTPTRREVDAWITEITKNASSVLLGEEWHSLEPPFSGGTFSDVFSQEHFVPGRGAPALDARVIDSSWRKQRGWFDNEPTVVPMHRYSVRYFYRQIVSPTYRPIDFSITGTDGCKVWLNGQALFERQIDDRQQKVKIALPLTQGANHLVIKVGCATNEQVTVTLEFSEPIVSTDTGGILRKAFLTVAERQEVADYYREYIWSEATRHRQEIRQLEASKSELFENCVSSMVMEDLPIPRPTYLLVRGAFNAPDHNQEVAPSIPDVFPPLPEGAPKNRLGLALWMLRDDHPLTAQVAVNRYWSMMFGRGIVPTLMDFGNQGELSSHPDLLDWLAIDFQRHGWNVKRMIKQMAMSSTYQQTSERGAEATRNDPENILLARGSRFRLQAEFIRDHALAVSGLLVDQIGGPGVKPYQPPGLWAEVADGGKPVFVQDHGNELYRRSMYTYWKRAAPHPGMIELDAPTRDKCQLSRQQSNTPLQALYLLNDLQYVEAARHLAERIVNEGGDDATERLQYGFRICTSRAADSAEIDILKRVLHEQQLEFDANRDRAIVFLSNGESSRDTSLDPSEHAAWTVIASMLLNLDETLSRR